MTIFDTDMRLCGVILLFCSCQSGRVRPAAISSPSPSDGAPAVQVPSIPTLPSIGQVVLTTEQTFAPHARNAFPSEENPADPTVRKLLTAQYGNIAKAPGVPYQSRTLYAYAPPAPGPHARRLVRLAHLADLQLADDESPVRMALLDGAGQTSAAFRPQEGHGCHIVSAAVRTINALHRKDPMDFVLLGGDNVDNAQENELDWVLRMFNGGTVDCDSGANDDPTPGPGNDVKDPYVSEGLLMPTKWITGNHDILVQGNLGTDTGFKDVAIGSEPKLGTRDYRRPGAPITDQAVPADSRRALLDRGRLMQRIARDGDGHGIGMLQQQSGKATYYFDVPNTALRFVVLDTSAELGGAEGLLLRSDVDRLVKPILDEAKAQGKWIILASHHPLELFTREGGIFGRVQGEAFLPDEWEAFIRQYPVVYSLVAHSHMHQVRAYPDAPGRGFFEVMTASLLDFPGQFRVIEIWDQDNGWLMLRATAVDYSGEGDPFVEEGRQLMFVDWATGWGFDGSGTPADSNVELWVEKPTP